MANRNSGHQPGGGLHSKNVVQQSVRTGSGSRGTHPGGVAQLGQHVGDHTTNRPGSSGYRGEPLHTGRNFQPVEFGNAIAARTVCKPGGSREVMPSGGQGTHGPVAGSPRPPGRGFDERG
jgi:hypothetical protein